MKYIFYEESKFKSYPHVLDVISTSVSMEEQGKYHAMKVV
jgi:hypothetical protein